MAVSKYKNTDYTRVPDEGGSVRVTIASNVGQGNGGTSLPCKEVWLLTDGTDVRVNIGSACTAITGLPVPPFIASTVYADALRIPIDDVSKLYFYGGTNAKVVDILYRL
jgi:hypothetical protein